jgi:solute:Na+ symporter, SSS family
MNKRLDWVSVGVSLVTIHYGLGFLVGSGEAINDNGALGILYAVASALGLFSLMFIADFYRAKKLPIWDLMGNKYGTNVKNIVGSLSGVWMIGVVASQILGGAWALSLLGFNHYMSMILIASLILLLSHINIGKLSKIFFYMLMFSSLSLALVLFKVGLHWLPISIEQFIGSLTMIGWHEVIGVIGTTVLVTFIGMDFHQFLVRAKNGEHAIKGSAFGGVILLVLAFVLLAIVNGALRTGLVGNISDPKQTVPAMLLNFGKSIHPWAGVLFALPVVFVSIGSGSGVTKIVSKTIKNLGINKIVPVESKLMTVLLSLIIAVTGGSIINLIVEFYAIYVASVIVPFLIYLLHENKVILAEGKAIYISIVFGMIASIVVFLNRFVPGSPLIDNQATNIMVIGALSSLAGFLLINKTYVQRKGS